MSVGILFTRETKAYSPLASPAFEGRLFARYPSRIPLDKANPKAVQLIWWFALESSKLRISHQITPPRLFHSQFVASDWVHDDYHDSRQHLKMEDQQSGLELSKNSEPQLPPSCQMSLPLDYHLKQHTISHTSAHELDQDSIPVMHRARLQHVREELLMAEFGHVKNMNETTNCV